MFDRISALSPIPIISAIGATCDAALSRGVHAVALLGTEYTMIENFFRGKLEQSGLSVITPNADEIAYIQDKIVNELEHGTINVETQKRFAEIIERMRRDDGAESVILGCTEIPLLINEGNSPLPCSDTVAIHTKALITAILES